MLYHKNVHWTPVQRENTQIYQMPSEDSPHINILLLCYCKYIFSPPPQAFQAIPLSTPSLPVFSCGCKLAPQTPEKPSNSSLSLRPVSKSPAHSAALYAAGRCTDDPSDHPEPPHPHSQRQGRLTTATVRNPPGGCS